MHIRLEGLTIGVGDRTLLSNLNGSFLEGTMTALLGPSGSGKSTLLATLAGQIPPKSGTIHLDGLQKSDIALMSQSPAILSRRTVRDNVVVGALASGASFQEGVRTANDLLKEMDLLPIAGLAAFRISGGERQRVAILRVIAKGDHVILADEPTASLDPNSRSNVVDTLRSAADHGSIVVVATHDSYVAERCDAILSPWTSS